MDFVASQVNPPSHAPPTVAAAQLARVHFLPSLTKGFSYSIIQSGHALPFTAVASPPTVTLPRLKALTTGANPTFLDAILNIAEDNPAAALENVDSWVRQMAIGDGFDHGMKRNVVFFGDDTWLRLFPKRWFRWQQGVSSFYVAVSSCRISIVARGARPANLSVDQLTDGDGGLCRTRRRWTRT
jgi:hypothetical protein